jgi:hypothetical protein
MLRYTHMIELEFSLKTSLQLFTSQKDGRIATGHVPARSSCYRFACLVHGPRFQEPHKHTATWNLVPCVYAYKSSSPFPPNMHIYANSFDVIQSINHDAPSGWQLVEWSSVIGGAIKTRLGR